MYSGLLLVYSECADHLWITSSSSTVFDGPLSFSCQVFLRKCVCLPPLTLLICACSPPLQPPQICSSVKVFVNTPQPGQLSDSVCTRFNLKQSCLAFSRFPGYPSTLFNLTSFSSCLVLLNCFVILVRFPTPTYQSVLYSSGPLQTLAHKSTLRMATRNSSGDDENPFYCPSMPAVTFLQTIRRKLKIKNVSNASKKTLPSFLQILDQSVDNEDIYSLLYPSTPAKDLLHTSSDYSPEPDDVSVLFNRTSGRKYDNSGPAVPPGLDFHQPLPGESKADSHGICGIKRRRADSLDSFSDILGPTKHARSSLTVNESSFELSGKADRIHFFRGGPSSSDNVICTDRADQDELTHRFRLVHGKFYKSQYSQRIVCVRI